MESASRPKGSLNPLQSTTALIHGARVEAMLLILLLAIVCLVSWPGMTAPRLLDDNDQLEYCQKFSSWKDCLTKDAYDLFRPLKNLIFYGMRDASNELWHTFTLSCFLFGTLGVYTLLRRLTACKYRAFIGGLFWATSPTQTVIAVWMTAANLSLAVGLSCFCIVLHDISRSDESRPQVRKWLLIAATCLVLFVSQVCYETAVATAGLCLLTDVLKKRPLFSRMSMIRFGLYGVVTLVFLLIRSHYGATHSVAARNFGFDPEIENWQLFLSAPWFMWKHFSMWVMPIGRIEFCSSYIWGKSASMMELAGAWLFLVLLFAIFVFSWKRARMVSIGLAWFFFASFPSSNFVPIGSGPIEDYYLIFPSVGLVLVILGLLNLFLDWMRRGDTDAKRLAGGSLLFVLMALRFACIPVFWLQADLWNRPIELYLRMIDSRPYQYQLQAVAAVAFAKENKYAQAEQLAVESFQTGPWHPGSNAVLGTVYLNRNEMIKAQTHFINVMNLTDMGSPPHDYSRLYYTHAIKESASIDEIKSTLMPLLRNGKSNYHVLAIQFLVKCYQDNGMPEDALRAARTGVERNPGNRELISLLESLTNPSEDDPPEEDADE